MISFEPVPVGNLLMPIVVSIGIWRMEKANKARAETGNETLQALRTSVDALRELIERGRKEGAA